MVDEAALGADNRRRAVYSYLRPILEGRRVIEIGCGDGAGLAHLLSLGARAVAGADRDEAALERARRRAGGARIVTGLSAVALQAAGPFDVVLVPEAADLVRGAGEPALATVRGLLAPGGHLVCVVPSGDHAPGGVGYYEALDALAPHFPRVRMFGQTPFVAFGLAEFDEATGGLRIDSGLVDESAEQPTHYLAVAGPDEAPALGYALVQVPLGAAPAAARPADDAAVADLRRRLAEAQGQAEGALRVSRAQAEEIEELRARLRRAAESRAQLDDEVTRLRRALAEADESVLNLTRRTTEEMAALAQRLTAGLRPPREEAGPAPERVRALEAALAARESALSERDERIAALEAERQDLVWRLESAEAEARRPAPAPGGPAAADTQELLATLRAREQALEEYRRAAQVHVDEVARLRDALTDQATLVAELEEALEGAEGRLSAAEEEAARLRKLAAETEEADRQRRSRLAELEGTLLRLQRQAAVEAERRGPPPEEVRRLTERAAQLEQENRTLRARLDDADRGRQEIERRWGEATERIVGLERAAAESEVRGETEEALRARISELEARQDGTRLASALAEVERLRGALQRSEEQLWEARGRLLADRDRIAESAVPPPVPAATAALLEQVAAEVAAIEAGLRAEVAQLAAVERGLAEWRTALGRDGAPAGAAPAPES